MKPNNFTVAKSLAELQKLAPPGCSLVVISGESPEEAQAEIVTVMGYNEDECHVVLTHPSLLFKSNMIPFAQARFAASRWIDISEVDFEGLIGESFQELAKILEEPSNNG